jgi:hypothetical protein
VDAAKPPVPPFERSGSRNSAPIQKIQNWLLSSDVQLTDGPHRGGVAGWLNEKGIAEFLYPELMGYYLTWLAFLSVASRCNEAIYSHARNALRWISDRFADGSIPPTRLYLQSSCEDWRNSVIFSFDAAMLSRGVALAPCSDDAKGREEILARILNYLGCFIDGNGFIQPYLRVQSGPTPPLPDRWSLAIGPYQLKIAAAIFSLPPDAVPHDLAAAAERFFGHWRNCFLSNQLKGETHPILYYLEGLLLAGAYDIDEEAWSQAAFVYNRLMEAQLPEGSLPSRLNDTGTAIRSDVLAQALRIGSILRSRGYLSHFWEEKLATLAMSLKSFVQNDGSVQFCRDGRARHRNTCSAIFSHQALCFFERLSTGQTIPDGWLRLLI